MTNIPRLLLAAGLAALLVACSTAPAQRQAQRQAAFVAAAGQPVSSFRFFNLYSWEPLGRTQLVVYTRPNEAWLLDLAACQDLEFTPAIGLTSSLHRVQIGFDRVLTARHDIPCTINQIRPVDMQALKLAEAGQRRIHEATRTDGAEAGAADPGARR